MSLSSLLPQADVGDPAEQHLRLEELKRTVRALIKVLSGFEPENIVDSTGMVLSVLAKRSGRDTSSGGYPFQCFDASVDSDTLALVYIHSHVLQSIKVDEHVTVSGLGSSFSVGVGTKVWLEFEIDRGEVTSGALRHGPTGWEGFPEPVKFEGLFPFRVQTKAYALVAYAILHSDASEFDPPGVVLGAGATSIMLVNVIRDHLLMASTCYKGDSVLYPMPWSGAYITG